MKLSLRNMLIGCGILVIGTACASHVHPPYQHGPIPTVGLGISFYKDAPPARKAARPLPRPNENAVWRPGHWKRTEMDYIWYEGFWDDHPPEGRVWVAGEWIHTDKGWYLEEGKYDEAPE